MTAVLWFNRGIYECTHTSTTPGTTYSCDSSTWTAIGTSCADSAPEYKVMITLDNFDAVLVDAITVSLTCGATWTIDSWCVDTSSIAAGYAGESAWQASSNQCSGSN